MRPRGVFHLAAFFANQNSVDYPETDILVSGLGTIGIDISAMVAGLGLTGFALGFAMKDILSNMISGILILLYQPFSVEDNIKVDKFEGKVTEINLRYTSIKQNEEIILLPNSFIYSKPIVVKK